MCSVSGGPPAGGPRAGGGVRRPHGLSEQQLRGREFPSAAEAAGLLPPAAAPPREEQRGRPGEGEAQNDDITAVLVVFMQKITQSCSPAAPRGVQSPVCSEAGVCRRSGGVSVSLRSAGESRDPGSEEGRRGSSHQGTTRVSSAW